MSRRFGWIVVIAVIAVSCTDSAEESTTASSLAIPPVTTSTTVDDGPLPGRIVVINLAGNVVVTDPDGANSIQITDGAAVSTVYFQPIWSSVPNTLAWGQATEDGFGIGIAKIGSQEPTVVETAGLPFYLYFSPHGDRLGVLNNGPGGLEFSVVDMTTETLSVLDGGSPFYFSWSPTGDRLAVHVGVDRFETLDPLNGDRRVIGSTDGGYLAPKWGPNGIFHVNEGNLVAQAIGGVSTVLAGVGEFTLFVANPQGSHVALQTAGGPPAISVGLAENADVPNDSLVVVNVETGAFDVVSNDPTFGFFWSPDGRSLLAFRPTANGVRAIVWDLDGSTKEFAEFRMSPFLIRDLFPFFPQYAQSLSFWSPDSRAFAYASEDGVFVQRLDESEAVKLADGFWVAWSK